MQFRHRAKITEVNRLIAEARSCLGNNDLPEASRGLHTALQADPSNIAATKLTADLFEGMGSPAAVAWRIRTIQLQPTNLEYRLDWAQTATRLREFKSARDALSGLAESGRVSPRYHKIAGALAWAEGKKEEAEQQFEAARKLEPENPANVLNLGTIGLTSSNQQLRAAAQLALQALAATNGPYMLDAERRLFQDAQARKELAQALACARLAAINSAATVDDKIEYLSLATSMKDPAAASYLAELKRQAAASPAAAFRLGAWLLKTEGADKALVWLISLPATVRANQPVPTLIADCRIALKDWSGLLDSVQKQDWGEPESLRLALESLARRSLGDTEAGHELWQRARLQAARQLDRLYQLTQLTASWGWKNERRDLLSEILAQFPQETWASSALVLQLHEEGRTEELERLFSKLSAADPRNAGIKSSLARMCLLRNDQLPAAHVLAREAYERTPHEPVVASTYAYSLLLQGRLADALEVVGSLKPAALRIPWAAACYGVVEAQAGNLKAAREPLEWAATATLLPEEQALVRQAKTRLN
jgi:predicted Zn-dependent protease